jgi:hypothetical protein
MTFYMPVNLDPYCCAGAATYDDERSCGCANAWGNSFPREELPFGGELEVAGVPFRFPGKQGADHVECLGQTLSLGAPLLPTCGVALLCFGEMGDQDLAVECQGDVGVTRWLKATAKEWLVHGAASNDRQCYACSHLHYPGGYELSLLRPVCWVDLHTWETPVLLKRMRLGFNPLFHLFAITLVLDPER